jgi:uncharacterized protein (TIGR00290 family)
MSEPERLNVIALVSGGKDSFFSALHALQNGHRLVALANLAPTDPNAGCEVDFRIRPEDVAANPFIPDAAIQDLDSFMYQSAGHQVIPVYPAATGLPLYSTPVSGRAVHQEKDYDPVEARGEPDGSNGSNGLHGLDETESMFRLLKDIMTHHPEANAVCAGAILSTYQRTRVESVALRLGLTPLAYLWKYTVLPPPPGTSQRDDAQLLRDMAAAGLDARIVKVASGGLDERDLWRNVCGEEWIQRARAAMRRFGGGEEGSVLGEGGEFETLVVNGPERLFRKRIVVDEDARDAHTESSQSWLTFRHVLLEDRAIGEDGDSAHGLGLVRVPALLDRQFGGIFNILKEHRMSETRIPARKPSEAPAEATDNSHLQTLPEEVADPDSLYWWVWADRDEAADFTIEWETDNVVQQILCLLQENTVPATAITNTIILLRRMADFPKVNRVYGSLFSRPNPPSRVTISCGDLLPPGRNIVIHLAVQHPAKRKSEDRNGLHVQSRSYWAPANIGPYSQAVDYPIWARPAPEHPTPRLFSVAGQIPLVPATMVLPDAPTANFELQVALSLQHLWRIGVDRQIQFWSSGAAYFPRTPDKPEMKRKALLAATAWHEANEYEEGFEPEEGDSLDPWDSRYNASFTTRSGLQAKRHELPDRNIFELHDQRSPNVMKIPPFFAVEVEDLPRGADVEWHAHLGFAQLGPKSIRMVHSSGRIHWVMERWEASHLVAESHGRSCLHSYVHLLLTSGADDDHSGSEGRDQRQDPLGWLAMLGQIFQLATVVLAEDCSRFGHKTRFPYLAYVDCSLLPPWDGSDLLTPTVGIIPCQSIWSAAGARLAAVGLFMATAEAME